MNDTRDPNLAIGAWLEDGPTELPESTRRSILTAVRTVDQRRGLGARWPGRGTGALRPALLAAALVVAVSGVYLFGSLGSGNSLGPPTGSARPTDLTSPATTQGTPPVPIEGQIAFTRYDSDFGPFGAYLGTFTVNADGSAEQRLDLPFPSDGIVWSPDGSRLMLPGVHRPGQPARPAVANADGSDYRVLEIGTNAGDVTCGAWAPDGQRLLCAVADGDDPIVSGIYLVKADCSETECLSAMQLLARDDSGGVEGADSTCSGQDVPGDFSPEGTRFVFLRELCGPEPDPAGTQTATIHVGTIGQEETTEITIPGFVHPHLGTAHWSPDGEWILFGGVSGLIYRVRPDGTDRQTVPISPSELDAFMYSPAWSPDGSRIVFTMGSASGSGDDELYTSASDGSDLRRITHRPGTEDLASWGPPRP